MPWTEIGKRYCRYADWRPNLYHQIKWVSSLVAVPSDLPLPPAAETDWKFYIYSDVPHTHTHRQKDTLEAVARMGWEHIPASVKEEEVDEGSDTLPSSS